MFVGAKENYHSDKLFSPALPVDQMNGFISEIKSLEDNPHNRFYLSLWEISLKLSQTECSGSQKVELKDMGRNLVDSADGFLWKNDSKKIDSLMGQIQGNFNYWSGLPKKPSSKKNKAFENLCNSMNALIDQIPFFPYNIYTFGEVPEWSNGAPC